MRGGGRSQRSEPARRRQLNGSVLFRQSPSSLVITAIRGFQVQLQAHLFVRLCVGFVWVCSCLCHTVVQILVSPHNYTLKEEWNLHFTLKYHCVVWRTNKTVTVSKNMAHSGTFFDQNVFQGISVLQLMQFRFTFTWHHSVSLFWNVRKPNKQKKQTTSTLGIFNVFW